MEYKDCIGVLLHTIPILSANREDENFYSRVKRYIRNNPEVGYMSKDREEGDPIVIFNDGYWGMQDNYVMQYYICKKCDKVMMDE